MARGAAADIRRVTDAVAVYESFYTRDGDRYAPTGLGISPWNPRAQMGAALAGLVAHALDLAESPVAMVPVRLTIDIMGAVPLGPLTCDVTILREGARLQLLAVNLLQGSRVWVRATALRVRAGTSPSIEAPLSRPFPIDPEPVAAMWNSPLADTMRVQGGFPDPGPGAWWVRPKATVVAGEPLRPLERVAMVADYGSGVAPLVSPRDWTFANLDVALHLSRLPRGEWVLVDATSESAGNGIGLAHTRLGDRDGMFGAAHQSIFLDSR